jgi:hypothetical protein
VRRYECRPGGASSAEGDRRSRHTGRYGRRTPLPRAGRCRRARRLAASHERCRFPVPERQANPDGSVIVGVATYLVRADGHLPESARAEFADLVVDTQADRTVLCGRVSGGCALARLLARLADFGLSVVEFRQVTIVAVARATGRRDPVPATPVATGSSAVGGAWPEPAAHDYRRGR